MPLVWFDNTIVTPHEGLQVLTKMPDPELHGSDIYAVMTFNHGCWATDSSMAELYSSIPLINVAPRFVPKLWTYLDPVLIDDDGFGATDAAIDLVWRDSDRALPREMTAIVGEFNCEGGSVFAVITFACGEWVTDSCVAEIYFAEGLMDLQEEKKPIRWAYLHDEDIVLHELVRLSA